MTWTLFWQLVGLTSVAGIWAVIYKGADRK